LFAAGFLPVRDARGFDWSAVRGVDGRGWSGLNRAVRFLFNITRTRRQASSSTIEVGEKSVPLLVVRNPRARRYVLRLRPDGTVRVTVPRGGSESAARQFVQKHVSWLKTQMERTAASPGGKVAWPVGFEILFRGEPVKIGAGPDGSTSITLADQAIHISKTSEDHRSSIERHLHRLAATELPARVFHFARNHGLKVQRVTVRNQKTRWGSCSRRGTISLNWRLIQAPTFVADYIILHELMHLRQMNHSRKYWQEVEKVCPGYREAEQWLKAHARLLR